MSRKVMKRKISTINLEPDGYSIHTFELSRRVTKSEWKQARRYLYAMAAETNQSGAVYPDRQSTDSHICTLYAASGVRLRLEHCETGNGHESFYLRMIVNPRQMIDPGSGYIGILPPEKRSVKLLAKAFEKLFGDTPMESDIRKYDLSRVDPCTNIHCADKRVFRELVRLLRKTATPKKYERKKFQHRDRKKANRYNKHYIRIACGSQELVIYDKTYQMAENNLVLSYEKLPEGVLRVAVHYGRDKLRKIEKEAGNDDPPAVLWQLMQESKERILSIVQKCYPELDYLGLDEGIDRINCSRFSAETKARMSLLLREMQRRQTVDAALQKLEAVGVKTDSLPEKFAKLGVSPVPLRKGFAAKRLPGFAEILRSVDKQPVCIELEYWKWK